MYDYIMINCNYMSLRRYRLSQKLELHNPPSLGPKQLENFRPWAVLSSLYPRGGTAPETHASSVAKSVLGRWSAQSRCRVRTFARNLWLRLLTLWIPFGAYLWERSTVGVALQGALSLLVSPASFG